jgi:hypothetical protein
MRGVRPLQPNSTKWEGNQHNATRNIQLPNILLLLTLAAASAVFVMWRIQARSEAAPPGHLGLVWDTSTSVPRNCDALVATVRSAIDRLHVAKGSRFALITTGSTASRYEPVLALETDIPSGGRNIFGGVGAGKTREEFYGEVKRACEAFGPADGSSIFRAAEIAIDHVRGFGCADASDCHVIVSTDLEENVNDTVRKRVLRGAAPSGAVALLDNAGLSVTFCGYTQSSIPGGPRTEAHALVEGWRGLFSQPVVFRPYCDAPTPPATN